MRNGREEKKAKSGKKKAENESEAFMGLLRQPSRFAFHMRRNSLGEKPKQD